MTKEDNNRFDSQIRSILESGQEELPQLLWSAIEHRLPSVTVSQKHRSPWSRRIAFAAGAVAACTIAILSLQRADFHQDDIELIREESKLSLVEETSDKFISTQESTETFVPQSMTSKSINPKSGKTIPEEETATGAAIQGIQAEVPDKQVSESPAPKTESISNSPKASEDKSQFGASWNDILSEKNRMKEKARVSVVAFGNAASNTNSNKSGAFGPAAKYTSLVGGEKTSYVSESSESSYSIPLCFGIGAKIDFTDSWALGFGLNTSILNRTFDGTFTEIGSGGTKTSTAYKGIRNTQVYMGIPLNVYYNIISKKAVIFYAYAGGAVEKCLSNKFLMPGSSTANFTQAVSGVQLSAGAGVGVQFNLGKVVGIYLDPSIKYYFDMNQPNSIRTRQPLMAGFELGLRFNL